MAEAVGTEAVGTGGMGTVGRGTVGKAVVEAGDNGIVDVQSTLGDSKVASQDGWQQMTCHVQLLKRKQTKSALKIIITQKIQNINICR